VIDYVNAGAADRFMIVVQNVRGAAQPRNLNLFSFQPEAPRRGRRCWRRRGTSAQLQTATRSIAAQGRRGGLAVSVIAVGAICSASASAASAFPPAAPDESCLDTFQPDPGVFQQPRRPSMDG